MSVHFKSVSSKTIPVPPVATWRCPSCHKSFQLLATKQPPSLCPKCEARHTIRRPVPAALPPSIPDLAALAAASSPAPKPQPTTEELILQTLRTIERQTRSIDLILTLYFYASLFSAGLGVLYFILRYAR